VVVMAKPRVLLIENEESISEPLADALEREGFLAEVAATATQGMESFRSRPPELVLLDVMLPDGDGREVLRDIRAVSRTPVVMLTARGEESDKIVGLELGADDYVTKPFSAKELVARMRAVLRRTATSPPTDQTSLEVGDVVMDLNTRAVKRAGAEMELTLKEYELLRMLMEQAGRVISREDLIDEVWDTNWFGPTKTLDVHISSLRKKLGDDTNSPRYIHTARGVGFRFASAEELRA
jgi:two-component system, OmpR family, response regulator RegX3